MPPRWRKRPEGGPTATDARAAVPTSPDPAVAPAELPPILARWPEALILVDAQHCILGVNVAGAALIGQSSARLRGRELLELVHVDDRSGLRDALKALALGLPGGHREFRVVSPAGVERWVDAFGANLLDLDGVEALVVHARDCTARKHEEFAVQRAAVSGREADRRYRVAFETTLVGMATADIDGFYIDVNAALCQLLDRARNELVGRHLSEGVHPDDGRAVEHTLAQMVTERLAGSQQQEVRYLRGDGTVIVADAAFVSICDDHGAPLSLMVFVQDVTARHAAVAALESALHREQQAAQQLRDLEETKAHLLASVSHDFQTPLTAIAGFAQLLATCWDDYDDDQKRDFAARITRNAGELDARVAEFLDLARHDHDARTLELVPCRLDDLVRQAVERCRFVLERHVVEVEVEPIELTSDAVSIGRIVDNLLTNAAKYSPPGTTVAVTVDHDGPTTARVVVRDQGAGVPADQRERIFQPFVRLEGSKASAPGAGVGLESGRALAELLGGTLTVHDNHPVGSAFTLTLPADLAPAAATPGG